MDQQPPAVDVTSSNRVFGLDAARACAVIAMVFGHSMHALLSSEAMQVGWVQRYWHVRAFTGPLFLFLSGWVVFLVIRRRELTGAGVLRAYLPRVTLLFALGYLVRLPIWDLPGLMHFDGEVWRYFSTFDALQCIAASMLVTLLVCAATASPHARIAVLTLLAAAVVAFASRVYSELAAPGMPKVLAQTFGGGDSNYAFLPWAAYFFAGAVVGALVMPGRTLDASRIAVFGRGGLLAVLLMMPLWPIRTMAATDPWRFVGSVGVVLAFIALVCALPAAIGRTLAPIGRASLWAYVVHLPVVYGWGYWPGLSTRIGPYLSDLEAAGMAVTIAVGSVTVAVLAQRAFGRGRWRRGLAWSFEQVAEATVAAKTRFDARW